MIYTLRLIYCSVIITYEVNEGNKNGGASSAQGKMRNACNTAVRKIKGQLSYSILKNQIGGQYPDQSNGDIQDVWVWDAVKWIRVYYTGDLPELSDKYSAGRVSSKSLSKLMNYQFI